MFLLDGKPLAPDTAFEHDGIRYPANWLRLTSLEEKEAIGITEVPDPPTYDQRFYWGYDQDENLIPKDHTQLVADWVAQTKTTANTLLAPSDWQVIREADNGTVIEPALKTERENIRSLCQEKCVAIEATTTTDELATYVTSGDYNQWT